LLQQNRFQTAAFTFFSLPWYGMNNRFQTFGKALLTSETANCLSTLAIARLGPPGIVFFVLVAENWPFAGLNLVVAPSFFSSFTWFCEQVIKKWEWRFILMYVTHTNGEKYWRRDVMLHADE
jgi:hypothetical protein